MGESIQNSLGLFLRELRGKMPLREVALKSGLSHTYIRDLELGINRKTKTPINPTPETLKRLSEAYNYSYDTLMEKAGYVDENNSLSVLDTFISKIIQELKQDRRTIEKYGDNPFLMDTKKMIEELSLKDKLDLLMAATDDLENFRVETNENGEKELILGVDKKPLYDLDDNNFADKIDLHYKGMQLDKSEKLEFLSIARAIFDARRDLKEKD